MREITIICDECGASVGTTKVSSGILHVEQGTSFVLTRGQREVEVCSKKCLRKAITHMSEPTDG